MRSPKVAGDHPPAKVERIDIAVTDKLEGAGANHHATIIETRSPTVPVSSASVRLRTAWR